MSRSTTPTQYASGYQEAMRDLARAALRGGYVAALTWLVNNLSTWDPESAALRPDAEALLDAAASR